MSDELVLAIHQERVAEVLGPLGMHPAEKPLMTAFEIQRRGSGRGQMLEDLLNALPRGPDGEFHCVVAPRSRAEKMTDWRQPITYAIVVSAADRKVLVATRTKKGAEGRLHERVTLGFGATSR